MKFINNLDESGLAITVSFPSIYNLYLPLLFGSFVIYAITLESPAFDISAANIVPLGFVLVVLNSTVVIFSLYAEIKPWKFVPVVIIGLPVCVTAKVTLQEFSFPASSLTYP